MPARVANDVEGLLRQTAVNELVPQVGYDLTAPVREGQKYQTLLPTRRSQVDERRAEIRWRVLSGAY